MKLKLITKFSHFLAHGRQECDTPYRDPKLGRRTTAKIEKWIAGCGWTEDTTLGGVAESLGIDKEDLSLYFRRKYRKSFLHWRKEMRIDEAKRLLLIEETIPTALIGEAVGIYDKSNFKRQFRDITGLTPAQWRSEHQAHI